MVQRKTDKRSFGTSGNGLIIMATLLAVVLGSSVAQIPGLFSARW